MGNCMGMGKGWDRQVTQCYSCIFSKLFLSFLSRYAMLRIAGLQDFFIFCLKKRDTWISPVLLGVCIELVLFGTSEGNLFPIGKGTENPELLHTHTYTHEMHCMRDWIVSLNIFLCKLSHLSFERQQRAKCPLNADCTIVKATSSTSPSSEDATSLHWFVASTAWK